MIHLRASSMDRFLACPPSEATGPGIVRINTPSEDSDYGNAGHEIAAQVVAGRDVDLDAIAARFGLLPAMLADVLESVSTAWAGIKEKFSDPHTEHEMYVKCPDWRVSGHADVIQGIDGHTIIVDWKFGRRADLGKCRYQMLAYAYLSGASTAEAHVYFHADRAWWTLEFDEEEIAGFRRLVDEAVAKIETGPYSPGDHCRYCPRRNGCPAHAEESRSLMALADSPGGDLSPAGITRQLRVLGQLDARVRELRSILGNHVRAAGGSVDDGVDGYRVQATQRRVVDVRKGWNALKERLGIDTLLGLLKVSVTDIDDAAKATAGPERGAKGKAVDKINLALHAAGAIELVHDEKVVPFKVRKAGEL